MSSRRRTYEEAVAVDPEYTREQYDKDEAEEAKKKKKKVGFFGRLKNYMSGNTEAANAAKKALEEY